MTTLTDDLEDQVRDVLSRQADALTPPAWHPGETPVRSLHPRPDPQRRWLWLASAAAVLALMGGLAAVVVTRPSAPSDAAAQGAEYPIAYGGDQVLLLARAVTVELGDRTFSPQLAENALEVGINSDPGDPTFTTLELTWFEQGVEMRINLYFASDGVDWWLSEARTYDGAAQGEWLTSTGEWARTPLGTAFEGDLTIGALHLDGLRLQAFTTGSASNTGTAPTVGTGNPDDLTVEAEIPDSTTEATAVDGK